MVSLVNGFSHGRTRTITDDHGLLLLLIFFHEQSLYDAVFAEVILEKSVRIRLLLIGPLPAEVIVTSTADLFLERLFVFFYTLFYF